MSFNIGLSGIRAAASDLNITGNNIANAGTVGFKLSRAEFSDVYAASVLGSGSNAQGSGVLMGDVSQMFTQGNINFTENSLDLAVNGNGFFVTSNNGALSYTRAGYFGTDRQGNIVNNFGERLQGFGVNGVTGQINQGIQTDLRVDTRSADPQQSTVIDSTLNLNSTNVRPAIWQQAYDGAYAGSIAGAVDPAAPTAAEVAAAQTAGLNAGRATFDPTNSATYNSSTSVNIYDSLGNPHVMTKYFVKNDANRWDMFVLVDGRDVQTGTLASDPAFDPTSTTRFDLQFNEAGDLTTPQPYTLSGWAPLDSTGQPTGAASPVNNLAINLRGTTQYASSFAVTSVVQDGFTTGELAGLEIDDTGLLVARYTNGQTRTQGQVVLATFANAQGLTPQGKTSWTQSFASGEPVVGAPTSGTLGTIQSGALESSNVDLSEQLINLIVAQRNYQANAKTIQTEDAVTQTIINLR
ncbi:flagellar hook protein FlgE [Halopseudomonas nanhaiensis]|uniref:flagellar hook protein FlgE n=1 Tax=Halopseudomonas nanhaiensis TaxID=2830842 RepID=UPI001CBEB15B|nr:flagellar hook protein FlgE [Halopseudomonas nanhaiensis]UAW97439.1 flagellar hook protein FlgE [Halopseudomonas nanhaiensis]